MFKPNTFENESTTFQNGVWYTKIVYSSVSVVTITGSMLLVSVANVWFVRLYSKINREL